MKARIAVLASTMALAASGIATGVAFGTIHEGPGKGNPQTNESGKCPAGQNKDTSNGGLKKCE